MTCSVLMSSSSEMRPPTATLMISPDAFRRLARGEHAGHHIADEREVARLPAVSRVRAAPCRRRALR
jgi:hypothetical protein